MSVAKRIKVGNADIGTTGNVKGGVNSKGGQHPFLPSADSYKGGKGKGSGSGASSDMGKGGQFPFLPAGNSTGLKKGGGSRKSSKKGY